jgi:hypothetical protein
MMFRTRSAGKLNVCMEALGGERLFVRRLLRCCVWGAHLLAMMCGLAVWFGSVCPELDAQTAHYAGWGGVVQQGTTLSSPFGVTIDSAEQYAYVGDTHNSRILRVNIATGAYTTPYAYNASTDPGCQNPQYPSVDSSNNVYFGCQDTTAFYKATYNSGTGTWGAVTALFTTAAGTGAFGSHIDSYGNLWIAEINTNSGQEPTLLKCTTSGSCSTYYTFPSASSLGVANTVRPYALTEDASGNFYIGDVSGNDVVWKLSNTGTASAPVAGTLTNIQSCPSLGVSYAAGCYGVTVDSSGDVYMGSNSPMVYKLTPNGSGYTASQITPVPGLLYRAVGIAVNASGTTLYAADYTDFGQNLGNGVTGPATSSSNLVRFGTTPQTLGSVAVGSTSAALTVNFSFDTAGTLGSISVVTQGVAGLDFANAGTGTCAAGTAYSAGGSCTVNVTFSPTKVGLRFGAVVLKNSSGTPFATGYVYGTGVGAVVDFSSVTQATLDSSATAAEGIVGDAAGNLYIAAGSAVYKETCTGSPCTYARSTLFTSALGTNFSALQYLAIDGAGNLYLGDGANGRIIKETLAAGSYTPQVICTTGSSSGVYCGANEVAVDVAGDVFYLSGNTSSVKELVFEPTPQSNNNNTYYSLPVSIAVNNNNPWGVAVDASGNVYYTTANGSSGQSLIKLTPAGATYESTTLDATLGDPTGISVDGLGNIYVAQYLGTSGSIVKETYNGGTSYTKSTIISSINSPVGVWADTSGNVFATSFGSGSVVELAYAGAGTLIFPSTQVGSTSASQTMTLQNGGNAPLVFSIPSSGTNPAVSANFGWTSTGGSACPALTTSSTSTASLAAGATCTLPVYFAPVSGTSDTGTLVLSDNASNGSTQTVSLSGTVTYPSTPTVTGVSPSSGTAGTSVTITGTNLLGATGVTFGSSAGVITADTATSLTVTAPAGSAGAVNVTVTTPGGSATRTGGFTYLQTLTSITVAGYSSPAITTEGSTVTVTAYDQNGMVYTGFTGTVTLSSSDSHATLPSAYTFQSSDAGVHTFSVTLKTLGTQWIRASSGAVSGSQTGIAVGDAVWVESVSGTLSKLNLAGTELTTGVGTAGNVGLWGGAAMDEAGNVWSVNSGLNALYFASAMGTGTTSYTGGGLNAPVKVAVDGAGMVWVANAAGSTVSEFTNAGAAQSEGAGYGSSYPFGDRLNGPSAIAVDGTGGVWVASRIGSTVTHIFGVAAPVVTPLAAATANGTLGVKP